LKRTQTRSWYNSRLVKAKISKGGFKIKAFHCLFRRGKTDCRHLNYWTAGISTIGLQAKRLFGVQKEHSAISRQGNSWKQGGVRRPHSDSSTTISRKAAT
jgi:hypothetical protein